NAKTSLCLPQRPLGHLRLLQNRDAPHLVRVGRFPNETRRRLKTIEGKIITAFGVKAIGQVK
ncbi:hypothetical protein QUB33_16120, partial [Microcoleus sp. B3-A4]|uniref:hypothetical protein n=1 Tax=Microcoleus sp. B3-A4 TaxID=2818653 RepID=UPI002FD3FADD